MLGMDFIKANRGAVERAIRDKRVELDLDALLMLDAEVRAAQKEAERSGTLATSSIDFPQDVRTMFEDVFEEMPWHLKEQQAQMVVELEAKRK